MGWERRVQEPGLRGDRHTQGPCRMGFRFCFSLHMNRCAHVKMMGNWIYYNALAAPGEPRAKMLGS